MYIQTFFSFFLLLLSSLGLSAQSLSGPELLARSIAYHDPNGNWEQFQGTFFLKFEDPEGQGGPTQVLIDRPNGIFRQVDERKGKRIIRFVSEDTLYASLDGKPSFSASEAEKYRLSKDQLRMYRDYYSYLYGLPMKLRDPGTRVQEGVIDTTFNGGRHLAIRVTYDPEVGSDTWLFYFDPTTYALKGYQFYKDAESKKGEYILIAGFFPYRDMRIPRNRVWYTYPDRKLLGTDVMEKVE
jgi:hypothetical protein